MFRRILVGYDGSPMAEHALLLAVEIALRFGSELTVLSVVHPPESDQDVEFAVERERLAQALHHVSVTVQARGLSVLTELVEGDPAETMLDWAQKTQADLLVVGRRGLSRWEYWVLGSVSEHVIRHARCAVLVAEPKMGPKPRAS
jgi:nucleotide-binding universal stress UspA family protein